MFFLNEFCMRTTFTLLGPVDFKNPCKIILPLYIIVAMILLNFDDNKTNFLILEIMSFIVLNR